MKHLNEKWILAANSASPSASSPGLGHSALGFRPAFLHFPTMSIHAGPLPPAHLVAGGRLIAGFERGGFFYTRRAASRACEEWRFVR